MRDSFAYPIIFMAIITAVFVSALAFLNYSTIDVIAFNENIDLQKKILYVFDIEYDEKDTNNINEIFNKHVSIEKEDQNYPIYKAEKDGNLIGYAYPVGGSGLWGTIDAYIGITEDFSKTLGLEFISQEETPGLGGRIDEKEFKEQFRNIDLNNAKDSNYIIYTPASGGNVDAISGATLTSKAVADFLNRDIELIKGGLQ